MREDDRSDPFALNRLKFHNKMASSLSNFSLHGEFPLPVNLEGNFLRALKRAKDESSAYFATIPLQNVHGNMLTIPLPW